MRRNRVLGLIWAIGMLGIIGCKAPSTVVGVKDVEGIKATNVPYKPYVAPANNVSVENRTIECQVLGSGPDVVLVIAAIHGDEKAGTYLCKSLAECLSKQSRLLRGRQVVLIPRANPDGMIRNQRQNARGIDLNRNFEADNRENSAQNGYRALTEPESRYIKRIIGQYKPNRIITLHEPLNCIDYDGPGEGIAKQMGRYSQLPVKKLGGRPGSLGSYAGNTLGIPIITMELPKTAAQQNAEQLWRLYGKALLSGVIYPQAVNE